MYKGQFHISQLKNKINNERCEIISNKSKNIFFQTKYKYCFIPFVFWYQKYIMIKFVLFWHNTHNYI